MLFIIEMLCAELIWLDSSSAVCTGHVATRTLSPAQLRVAVVTRASSLLYLLCL